MTLLIIILCISLLFNLAFGVCSKNPHWRAKPESWPYQLQLMLNAAITEEAAKKLLANNNFVSRLNNLLKTYEKRIPELKDTEITYGDDNHETLEPVEKTTNNPDINLNVPKDDSKAISIVEIKATKGTPKNAANFHNADIVLIYLIDTTEFWLRVNLGGIYSDPELVARVPIACKQVNVKNQKIPTGKQVSIVNQKDPTLINRRNYKDIDTINI